MSKWSGTRENAEDMTFQRNAPIKSRPEEISILREDHAAVAEGRTLFPSTRTHPSESPRLLVEGHNSRKIGNEIRKGAWAGARIYTLTLEERATCPRSCHHWQSCFGNAMHLARRHVHGEALETLLPAEVDRLSKKHDRFAVRLHVLGDFYSNEYANLWGEMCFRTKNMLCFGFTAHSEGSEIGQTLQYWHVTTRGRFNIRFSSKKPGIRRAVTVNFTPQAPVIDEGVVCPAATGKTMGCGTCALCWTPAFDCKTVVFPLHGPKWGRGGRKAKP